MFDIVIFLSSIVYAMAEGCRMYYTGNRYSNLFDIAATTSTSLAKTCRIYDSGIVTPAITFTTSKK